MFHRFPRIDSVQYKFGRQLLYPIARTYHGELTDRTRKHIETQFDAGDVRILVATVAYALGVNPRIVKFVIVRGRIDTDEALQKLGRANRQSRPNDTATFFWLPESKVQGDRKQKQIRNRRAPLPGELILSGIRGPSSTSSPRKRPAFPNNDSDTDSAQPGTPLKKRPKGSYKNPAQFRNYELIDGEYEVYNPPEDSCYWHALMKRYDEEIPVPCNNCSKCAPDKILLVELAEAEPQENTAIALALELELQKLAVQLGNEVGDSLLVAGSPDPKERVLNLTWRKKFAQSYCRVIDGNRMGWLWDRMYGDRVTQFVQQYMQLSSRAILQTQLNPQIEELEEELNHI
ncbi:hypothetical protein V8E54_013643 [Elaphomyces granulatus]